MRWVRQTDVPSSLVENPHPGSSFQLSRLFPFFFFLSPPLPPPFPFRSSSNNCLHIALSEGRAGEKHSMFQPFASNFLSEEWAPP